MSAELTPADFAFLILLKAAGRELSNTEMHEHYQVRLVGAAYAKLNSAGFVDSNTKARPYRHNLTKEGTRALAQRLTITDGGAEKTIEKVLWAAVVVQQNELLKGRPAGNDAGPEPGPEPEVEPEAPVDLDGRVRAAYAELAGEPGDWVSLTALRRALVDVGKADLDKALEQMLDTPGVHLDPEPFGHRIGAQERAAAVYIGGEHRHKLAIGRP